MAERLTTRFHGILVKEADVSKIQVITKLGQLEDIMERLGINFVEDLEDEIKSLRVDKYIYKQDRDTWKRACELACEKLADIYSHCEYELFGDSVDEYRKYCEKNGNPLQNIRYCETKYFYQQAKKEGENNDTNN